MAKRFGVGTLVLLLTVSLCACGGGSTASQPSAASSAASSAPASTASSAAPSSEAPAVTDNPWLVSDEPITLKGLGHMSGLYVDVKDYNEIPAIQTFSEKTNIFFEWETTNAENETEQINLAFASKKLPDVFTHMKNVDVKKYGEQGALVDLLPLIREHAPNIMKALEADPATIPMYTSDGKLYGIPQIDADYRLSTFKTIIIQQAWLDKVGMTAPTDSEEFYQVLKAFKEAGSDLTDEVILPYSSYFDGQMEGWYDPFSWMFGTYGWRSYDKGGKLVFGAMEPEFKEVMTYIRKLYDEGLLDGDLNANKDDPTFEAKMTNNRVGIGYVGQGRIGTYNQKAGATYDAYEFVPMIPAKAPDGKVYFGCVGPLAHSTPNMAVSITNPYPVETVKAWDWFFSEEGQIAMNLGVEGETFEYVDGKAEYTDLIMKDSVLNANQTLLKYISPLYDFPCGRIYDFERAQLGPLLASYKEEMQSIGALNGVKQFNLGNLPIPAEDVATFAVIETDINTYGSESLVKFIRGEWNLDGDYDAFVSTLESMNISGLMEILNKGYALLAN